MSDANRSPHVQSLTSRLASVRGAIQRALVVYGSARILALIAGAVALSFVLDRFFKLEVEARGVLLLGGVGGLGWLVYRYLIRPLGKPATDDALAVAVEARKPQLGDRIINALQLSRMGDPERLGMSKQLTEEAIQAAAGDVDQISPRDVVDGKRQLRGMGMCACAGGLLLMFPILFGDAAGIWARRNLLLQEVRWPQKTYLRVDENVFPGRIARIVRGGDLMVTARSVGEEHPTKVTLHWRDSSGETGEVTMKAVQDGRTYRHLFQQIVAPVEFHLEGGDEVTDLYRIELMEPPEALDVKVWRTFPAYAEREPDEVDLSKGDPQVLPGGGVIVKGRSSKQLDRAALVLGEDAQEGVDGKLTPPDQFEIAYKPSSSMLLGVKLYDTDGLSNQIPAPRFLVRVIPDRAPRLRLRLEGAGPEVVPLALVPYRLRMRDDVKVVEANLRIQITDPNGAELPPRFVDIDKNLLNRPEVVIREVLDLGPLELKPGSFVTLQAFGKDNAQPESHTAKSEPVSLKVVSRDDFLSEIIRRQQEQRQAFEQLLLREKRLRDRFLDLRDAPPETPVEVRSILESQAREQRGIARAVTSVERAMTRILQEMKNNKVGNSERIDQLSNRVVLAMRKLRTKTMEEHAQDLDALGETARPNSLKGEAAQAIQRGFERIIAEMERILGEMQKVESFTEIVEQVKKLREDQRNARNETYRRWLEEMRKVFGDDFVPGEGEIPGGAPGKEDDKKDGG